MATRLLYGFLLTLSVITGPGSRPAASADPEKLVVYGASGRIGGVIVAEALRRGHLVTGVSRDPARLTTRHAHFTPVRGDITNPESVRSIIAGSDAVIVSVSGNAAGNTPEDSTHAIAARVLVQVLGEMGDDAPRVLQVGGATTMFESKQEMTENLPFPAAPGTPMYGMFFGHLVALNTYRASDVDWTVVTPPLEIIGFRGGVDKRTGHYRTATDALVRDAGGRSAISLSDLAVAVVDEVENAAYVRQRFTVGY